MSVDPATAVEHFIEAYSDSKKKKNKKKNEEVEEKLIGFNLPDTDDIEREDNRQWALLYNQIAAVSEIDSFKFFYARDDKGKDILRIQVKESEFPRFVSEVAIDLIQRVKQIEQKPVKTAGDRISFKPLMNTGEFLMYQLYCFSNDLEISENARKEAAKSLQELGIGNWDWQKWKKDWDKAHES